MRLEISTSCSRVSSGTWPICFEIHADRIVQNVILRRTGFLLLSFLLPLFVVLDLVRFEDLDFEILQDRKNVIDFLLVFDGLRQSFVDVVEGQITLLLGEPD